MFLTFCRRGDGPPIGAATPSELMLVALRAAVVTTIVAACIVAIAIPFAVLADGFYFGFGDSSDDRQGMATGIVMSIAAIAGVCAGVAIAWRYVNSRVDWLGARPKWLVLPAASLWLPAVVLIALLILT